MANSQRSIRKSSGISSAASSRPPSTSKVAHAAFRPHLAHARRKPQRTDHAPCPQEAPLGQRREAGQVGLQEGDERAHKESHGEGAQGARS